MWGLPTVQPQREADTKQPTERQADKPNDSVRVFDTEQYVQQEREWEWQQPIESKGVICGYSEWLSVHYAWGQTAHYSL